MISWRTGHTLMLPMLSEVHWIHLGFIGWNFSQWSGCLEDLPELR